jgi:hypothetical protein
MPKLQPDDYVEAEFLDKVTGESEWMMMQPDSCDNEADVQLGRLDNEPLLETALHAGDELAVRYEKIVEHRRASEFEKK